MKRIDHFRQFPPSPSPLSVPLNFFIRLWGQARSSSPRRGLYPSLSFIEVGGAGEVQVKTPFCQESPPPGRDSSSFPFFSPFFPLSLLHFGTLSFPPPQHYRHRPVLFFFPRMLFPPSPGTKTGGPASPSLFSFPNSLRRCMAGVSPYRKELGLLSLFFFLFSGCRRRTLRLLFPSTLSSLAPPPPPFLQGISFFFM